MTLPGQNPETKTIVNAIKENRQRLKQLKRLKGKLTKEKIIDCLGLFTHNENAIEWYQQALIETALDRVNWDEILDKVNSL